MYSYLCANADRSSRVSGSETCFRSRRPLKLVFYIALLGLGVREHVRGWVCMCTLHFWLGASVFRKCVYVEIWWLPVRALKVMVPYRVSCLAHTSNLESAPRVT